MKVNCYNTQSALSIDLNQVSLLISALIRIQNIETHEVIVHFVDIKTITHLHETFFDDPTPTDCVSFPIDPPDKKEKHHVLGEIFICPQFALNYANERQIDPYHEASLYLIHSFLHLIGYKDQNAKDQSIMRKEETRCFELLQKKDALLVAPTMQI